MLKKNCFFLGTVVAKYSFKGEVLIKLDTDDPSAYQSLQSLLIEQEMGLVPYFVERAKLHKTQLLRTSIEDVKNEIEADKLIGKAVYLPLNQLPKLDDDKFYYHEIVGFEVIESSRGVVGKITDVNDTSSQVLLEVDHKQKTVLIPLVDDLLQKVDKKNKKLHISIPDGLLDL
jgi:16S rRNA processing protein RimM